MKTLSWSAGVALLAVAVCVPTADAATVKCQRTIAKASSQFVQAKIKAVSKCEGAIVSGSITGPCPDAKAAAAIVKATDKLTAAIGKSCGGDDKVCGGNFINEDSRASLGWPTVCPNFESGTCENPITDCGDIATCLACIGEAAVDQAIALYYDDLLPNGGDKPLIKCQQSIGKATSAFLSAKSKALQKCWDARLNGKHSGTCVPPAAGDGKYLAAIDKAEAKKDAAICKACGGANKACGGGDDIPTATITSQTTCPAVSIPSGVCGGGANDGATCSNDSACPGGSCGDAVACGGLITDLQSIVNCVDCVTEFKADCVDRLAVPQYSGYPSECNVCTLPPSTDPCPTSLDFTADGPNVDLDTGFTGLAHNAKVPTNGRLTLSVSGCAGVSQPTCGQCSVGGPLENAGGITFDNHRCTDAPWISCSIDQDCIDAGAAGPCSFFFGAPLPLVAGGVSTCVVNELNGTVSGTINIDDGTSTTIVPLSSKVHPTGTTDNPCPICDLVCIGGANTGMACANDGDCPLSSCSTSTLCGDGPRLLEACTPQGTSLFGDVSLDCPPNPGANVGTLSINLTISTGTQSVTVSAANPTCRQTGYTGLKCLCDTCNNGNQDACSTNADCPDPAGPIGPICGGRRCVGGGNNGAACTNNSECPGASCNRPGEATQPNVCQDDSTTVPNDALCIDIGNNEGRCMAKPVDQTCSIEISRPCGDAADCNPPPFPGSTCENCLPNQTCDTVIRRCFTDNGVIGNSVTVQGEADVPCGGVSRPVVGAFFCVAPVDAPAVNAAGGLPALGRVRIPGKVNVFP